MSQVVNGHVLGAPGPAGAAPICHLYGAGAPSTSTDPMVSSCQLGSLYSDYVGGTLWLKTSVGTWTQK